MVEAHITSVEVRELLISKLRSDKVASPVEILRIVTKYGDSVVRAIEVAAKLAPYSDPKLEAIEVKSEVEHRFVIRAPEQMKSVDDWMKRTGAEQLRLDQSVRLSNCKPEPPAPSIHDYEDMDNE